MSSMVLNTVEVGVHHGGNIRKIVVVVVLCNFYSTEPQPGNMKVEFTRQCSKRSLGSFKILIKPSDFLLLNIIVLRVVTQYMVPKYSVGVILW